MTIINGKLFRAILILAIIRPMGGFQAKRIEKKKKKKIKSALTGSPTFA